jgi:hypothetical protein
MVFTLLLILFSFLIYGSEMLETLSEKAPEIAVSEKINNSEVTKEKEPVQEKDIQSNLSKPLAPKEAKIIVISNQINDEMITYRHMTGNYTPEFSLEVNSDPINSSQAKEISSETINITYHAQFPYGYSSQDSADFTLKPETSKAVITFDWNQTPHIILQEE